MVDYILQVVESENHRRHRHHHHQEKILLLGNSIGGFTAASAAATLQSNYGFKNISLILVNSAGKIIEGGGSGESFLYSIILLYFISFLAPSNSKFHTDATHVQEEGEMFPPYKGPSSLVLKSFGALIFTLLQPNIRPACEWLYPSYPKAVQDRNVARNIYRDSCDPGASIVIASGVNYLFLLI